jgi:drug/metabolite transporter (DMT)-like permease
LARDPVMFLSGVDLFAFVLLAAVTGSGFTFVRYGSESFEPFTLSVVRSLIALVFLLCTVLSKALRDDTFLVHLKVRFTPLIILKVGIVSLFNLVLPYTLYAVIVDSLPVGLVAILMSTSPVFALVLSRVLLRGAVITPLRMIGMACGMSGIVLVSLYPLLNTGKAVGEGDEGSGGHGGVEQEPNPHPKGGVALMIVLTLCASTGKALGAVLGAKFLKDCHPIGISLFQCIWTLVLTTAAALVRERDNLAQIPHVSNIMAWIGVIYLGAFNSTLGPLLQFFLIARIGPSKQKTVAFLGPIFALVEGIILFKEWSHAAAPHIVLQIAGSGFILAGVYMVNRKPVPAKDGLGNIQEKKMLAGHASALIGDGAGGGDLATGLLVGSTVDENIYATRTGPYVTRELADPYATAGSFSAFYSTLLPDEFADPIPPPSRQREYMTSFDPAEFRRLNAHHHQQHGPPDGAIVLKSTHFGAVRAPIGSQAAAASGGLPNVDGEDPTREERYMTL